MDDRAARARALEEFRVGVRPIEEVRRSIVEGSDTNYPDGPVRHLSRDDVRPALYPFEYDMCEYDGETITSTLATNTTGRIIRGSRGVVEPITSERIMDTIRQARSRINIANTGEDITPSNYNPRDEEFILLTTGEGDERTVRGERQVFRGGQWISLSPDIPDINEFYRRHPEARHTQEKEAENFIKNNNNPMATSPFDRALYTLGSNLPNDVFQEMFVKNAPERRTVEFLKTQVNNYLQSLGQVSILDSMGRPLPINEFRLEMLEDECVVVSHRTQSFITDIPNFTFYGLFRKAVPKPGKEGLVPGAFVKIASLAFTNKIMNGFRNLENLVFMIADPEILTPLASGSTRPQGVQRIESQIPTNSKTHYCILNDHAVSRICYELSEDILTLDAKENYDKQTSFVLSREIKAQMQKRAQTGLEQAQAQYLDAVERAKQAYLTLSACLSTDIANDAEGFIDFIKQGIITIKKMKDVAYVTTINPFKISIVTNVISIKDRRPSHPEEHLIGHYNIIMDLSPGRPNIKMFLIGSSPTERQHPHILGGGDVCWGDAATMMNKGFADYDVASLTLNCLELLKTYNHASPYMALPLFLERVVRRLPTSAFKLVSQMTNAKAEVEKEEAPAAPAPRQARMGGRRRTQRATNRPPIATVVDGAELLLAQEYAVETGTLQGSAAITATPF